jgi:ribonuclease/clavin/mitogillin
MNIVNVGYDSTNYYVLGQSSNRILIDVGWPGTLPRLAANLKRKGISLREIGYLLVTHYHPDHAGLAQEVKNQGVHLIVLNQQRAAIPMLKSYLKASNRFVDVQLDDNLPLASEASRVFLKAIGVAGEIISTPGHSADSVTLILDEGAAFTGDLPGPMLAQGDALEAVARSWQAIRALGARTIYPGHGPVRPLSTVVHGSA